MPTSAPKPVIDLQNLVQAHWTEDAKQKAKLAVEFVQLIMNDHNFDEIKRRFSGHSYIQHNRTISDGIDGVLSTLKNLVKNAPEFSYEVKRIFVDGNHVVLHSHATLKAKHRGDDSQGFNIIDTWRVENGQLVEHWDAVEGISFPMRMYSLMTGGKVRNENGVF